MVDWGKDTEELANSLELDRFAVAGHSGGAPHALAIPYRMPERVTKVVLASPVSPLEEKGMAKLMINKDLKTLAKLHHLHHLIKWGSNFAATGAEKDIPTFVEATAADDTSDAPTFLDDPAQRAMFEASFAAGMAQGGEGMYEMIIALRSWGFEPPKMPLHLAERLPNCATHVREGAGHYGFIDRPRWSEFFSAVA